MTRCTWVDTVSEIMSPYWPGRTGKVRKRDVLGRGGVRWEGLVHFHYSGPLPPVVWPEYVANEGMLQLALLAVHPRFRGPENLWNDVTTLTRRRLRASRVQLNHEMKALKCQHKHQRSRVWPLGSAIPSNRPTKLMFLGQGVGVGACWLPGCHRQKTT